MSLLKWCTKRMFTFEAGRCKVSIPTVPFIANKYVSSGQVLEIINPTTNRTIVGVEQGNGELVSAAVEAAKRAFDGEWGRMDGSQRGECIHRIANVIEQNQDAFMRLETVNMGKPIEEAKMDISEAVRVLKYFAGMADKVYGYTSNLGATKFGYTIRAPVGVVGHIIPWNYPFLMAAWKLGPALVAGCCCVLKPSEFTPLSALYLTTFLPGIIPAGVVNIIPGTGGTVGRAICRHPGISKVGFTGSSAVGELVMKEAAGKRVTLECGGKNPGIVFEDADLDRAADAVMVGGFMNSGQVCSATSRFYIQNTIFDRFLGVLKGKMNAITIGDPLDPTTTMGPMATRRQYENAQRFLGRARDEGIQVVEWEGQLPSEGLYVKPVIFPSLPHDHFFARTELFCPFVSLHKFSCEQEAIDLANDSEYGLSASIFSRNVSLAYLVSHKIYAGIVWVNSNGDCDVRLPFGGWGRSGVGNELGMGAVNDYTKEKSVYISIE